MNGSPRALGAREHARGSLSHVPHAEREEETLERNLAACRDRGEEIAHRDLAKALDLLEPDRDVSFRERKKIGRLLDPALFEEQRDLLLAESLDVERAAGHEMPQMLDLL